MLLINDTKSSNKVDCAKECPCGVPVIPVPDQWLEVMVTGGFKVWHIIFIIIAFIVTIIVVYCCFHRCRIPRTKQEIEADLMRTNITNKFRDYLQEFPNEPTTFIEALKKVQELEEKSELDDAQFARDSGARKRMGWLKLKGKGADGRGATDQPDNKTETAEGTVTSALVAAADLPAGAEAISMPESSHNHQQPPESNKLARSSKHDLATPKSSQNATGIEPTENQKEKPVHKSSSSHAARTTPKVVEATVGLLTPEEISDGGKASEVVSNAGETKQVRQIRRRKHKPNLSRTKRAKELDVERPAAYETAAGEDTTGLIATQSGVQNENMNPSVQAAVAPTVKRHVHKVRIEHKDKRDDG